MNVKIKRLTDSAKIPTYAHAPDGCFDLYASELVMLLPRAVTTVNTGLVVDVPLGYVMLVYSRSGLARDHQITMANGVAVVDSGYAGEIKLPIHNGSSVSYMVEPGKRMAQAMIIPRPVCTFTEVETISNDGRGEGGFGSTDK